MANRYEEDEGTNGNKEIIYFLILMQVLEQEKIRQRKIVS